MKNLNSLLYKDIAQPFIGFELSKHFIDRYIERFNNPEILGDVIRKVNKELCLLIFDAERNNQRTLLKAGSVEVPLLLVEGKQNYYLKALTIYERI